MNATINPALPAIPFFRIATSLLLAGAVTFGLFVIMQKLIENNDIPTEKPTPPTVIDFIQNIDEPRIIETPRIKPLPEPPPQPQPITRNIPLDPNESPSLGPFVPELKIAGPAGPSFGSLSMDDGTAIPVVRMEPKYPMEAARNGIEGWVKLVFSIDVLGQVQNIEVVDSQPSRTFDRAAKLALAKWKYKPQVVNGTPQPQDGMVVVLDFKLAE